MCSFIATILFATVSHGQTFQYKYFKDGSYIFDDLLKVRQSELFTTYKSEFGLGVNDEMQQTNNVITEEGQFTTKYILLHKGIPVEGSMMNVIGDKGIVQYANGFLRTGLNADVNNIISEQQAIEAAIEFIDATLYPWQDSTLRAELIAEGEDPDSTLYPQHAELLITKQRGETHSHDAANYQLCYKVIIYALEPASVTNVFVNANTGDVFTSEEAIIEDYTAVGSVSTHYNGSHSNIKTRSCGTCFNFWLHDVDRNIYTTSVWKNPWQKGSYNKDNNNNWVESDTKTAATGQWSLQRAWEYYINRHGRWGTNYAGRRVHVRTDAPIPSNAGWNDDNGNDNIFIRPDNQHSAAMLDVLAHEYTHGMVAASSNLGVLGDFDARSMNEAYADIFGMRIEGYALGTHDWTFAEHMGTYQRNFADPHADFPIPSPAIYLEPGYWSSTAYHNNGGVLRKWFYLLSNGGTFNGNTVLPLGIETADDIAYITFNWWLWSNVQYPEAANQTVHATVAHWGRCSNEHKQVVKALRAVGFNIPNPLCVRVVIEGPYVIGNDEYGIVYKAKLNDIEDPAGAFEWQIPPGWNVTINGDELTLNSFSNTNTQKLSVTYTETNGSTHTDTIVVHFSDEVWEPTDNMPNQLMRKAFDNEEESGEGSINLYPNPANQSVQISLNSFKGDAKIEIFDLNGRLMKSFKTDADHFEINVSDLVNGLYIIKARTDNHTFTQKLSIIH